MTEKRVPKAGDAVRYTGPDVRRVLLCGEEHEDRYRPLDSRGRLGVLRGMIGEPIDETLVMFNLYGGRAFKGGNRGVKDQGVVSASGGPGYYISAAELEPTGETVTMNFWCWKDFPRGDGGEDYSETVPVWNWDPDKGRR